jgi:hypothetical protein
LCSVGPRGERPRGPLPSPGLEEASPREVRSRRSALAERCKDVGLPRLTIQALYKLEAQRERDDRPPRPVTVDELLVLAYVLDVAPVHLIAGLGSDEDQCPVTPAMSVTAAEARNWIRGFRALDGSDRRRFDGNVPASEENRRYLTYDATSLEDMEKVAKGFLQFVQAHKQIAELEADGGIADGCL